MFEHPFTLETWPDRKAWNEFVQDSFEGSVFCRVEFLDALGCPYELYRILDGDKTVAGIPILLDREGQPLKAPHPFALYQGPMFSNEIGKQPAHSRSVKQGQILEFALEELTARYSKISFCLHHSLEDLRPLQWFHFHEADKPKFQFDIRYTGLLDLSVHASFENYLQSIRKCRQQEFRKAVKEGFRVVTSGVERIPQFLELYTMTFQRQNINLAPEHVEWIQAIIKAALEKGFGEMCFCESAQGQPAAATLFLYDSKGSHYLLMANDPEFRKSGANTLLLADNIRRTQEKNLRWVDFIGINSPNRGDFKISMNASPKVYFQVHYQF